LVTCGLVVEQRTHHRGLIILLDALVAVRLLDQREDGYA